MSQSHPPSDRGIPLLTDVLTPAPEALVATTAPLDIDIAAVLGDIPFDEPETEQTHAAVSPFSTSSQWLPAAAPVDVLSENEHWHQLAQHIQEQVLQQLLGQVNNLLKQQVAEQMALVFEHITQQLTAQIQVNLEEALRQSVQLAVEQKIEKTRMIKRK